MDVEATVWLMLTKYVPASVTFVPAPEPNAVMTVPLLTPVPANDWPRVMAPDVIPVTVNMFPLIEPVKLAPIVPPGPIVY